MCDEHSMDDMIAYELRSRSLSRRQFGGMTLGATLLAALSPVANAAETTESEVEIKTRMASRMPISSIRAPAHIRAS